MHENRVICLYTGAFKATEMYTNQATTHELRKTIEIMLKTA